MMFGDLINRQTSQTIPEHHESKTHSNAILGNDYAFDA